MAATPSDILATALARATTRLYQPILANAEVVSRIELVCRYLGNRACARFILACTLAKAHHPKLDIRKPYTEIPDQGAYSGRTYDELYITDFVLQHELPCNRTTAFLTPAFRNRNITLTPDMVMVGRPEWLYKATLQLLTDVESQLVSAEDVLVETIRWLLIIRDERKQQIEALLANLKVRTETAILSSEGIVSLISQHLQAGRSSRLPVLVVAAAYLSAQHHLGERLLPFERHNAADEQTGAIGDLEIALLSDDRVVTCYEMKTRRVTESDIDQALLKVQTANRRVDNYIFITTERIESSVQEYAATVYERTGGIEVVVLDCLSFLRHFLHLFHRLRAVFLENYQQLVLDEPDSAVDQSLKVAFLALRQAAESRLAGEE